MLLVHCNLLEAEVTIEEQNITAFCYEISRKSPNHVLEISQTIEYLEQQIHKKSSS